MKRTNATDAARIELLLAELRLPAMKLMWADVAARADKEGWPASRFLAALAEHENADRGRRRIERHLAGAKLPTGKTFDTFDFNAVPMVSKAQVMALAAGDGWLDQGANVMLFGPLRQRLGWRSFKTAGACCSSAPRTSSSGCRWHAGTWNSRPPSVSSTSTSC